MLGTLSRGILWTLFTVVFVLALILLTVAWQIFIWVLPAGIVVFILWLLFQESEI